MKYLKRKISDKLIDLAMQYPVVTITGPRQSGKTTLCRNTFPEKQYFNLEDPALRQFVKNDPRAFLGGINECGAVIDEIQRVPELTSFIQPVVDENPRKGQFILTGSHQFELVESVNQSLAGRTGLLKLLPLSLSEIAAMENIDKFDRYAFNGFYPRIYSDNLDATDYYSMYFDTYIERDLRSMINIPNLSLFERFIKLLAGRTGSLLNLSSLTNDVGVSMPTLRNWLSVLEASYIVFLLQPYHGNITKRLTKSPKVYFCDTGLAAFLNGIENKSQIVNHPLRGAFFENLIISEFLKNRFNQGRRSNIYFYRDAKNNEVDLVCEEAAGITAVEIKSSETPNADFVNGIENFRKSTGNLHVNGFVYYAGNEELTVKNVKFTPWCRYAFME